MLTVHRGSPGTPISRLAMIEDAIQENGVPWASTPSSKCSVRLSKDLFHASQGLPDFFHVRYHRNIVVLKPGDLSGLVYDRDRSAGNAFFG